MKRNTKELIIGCRYSVFMVVMQKSKDTCNSLIIKS